MRRFPLSALVAIAALAAPLASQAPAIGTNHNLWFNYFGDHRFAKRWSLIADVSERRGDWGSQQAQVMTRAGVLYDVGSGVRVGGGVLYMHNTPYGAVPAAFANDEHRIWQQLSLAQTAGPVRIAHRYRIEERWISKVAADSLGQPQVQRWVGQFRFRYWVRALLPLRGAGEMAPGTPYLVASNEVFLKAGSATDNSVFDQNRLSAAFGVQVSKYWRIEPGYQYQVVARSAGAVRESNHTLVLSVFSTAPFN